jgi:AraC-like DNA-binding protein
MKRIPSIAGDSYFAKLFKHLTGIPVSDYITSLHIKEAARMLLGEECSVTEVALATGFNDISHFIVSFKRLKGQTPKQYKKISTK